MSDDDDEWVPSSTHIYNFGHKLIVACDNRSLSDEIIAEKFRCSISVVEDVRNRIRHLSHAIKYDANHKLVCWKCGELITDKACFHHNHKTEEIIAVVCYSCNMKLKSFSDCESFRTGRDDEKVYRDIMEDRHEKYCYRVIKDEKALPIKEAFVMTRAKFYLNSMRESTFDLEELAKFIGSADYPKKILKHIVEILCKKGCFEELANRR